MVRVMTMIMLKADAAATLLPSLGYVNAYTRAGKTVSGHVAIRHRKADAPSAADANAPPPPVPDAPVSPLDGFIAKHGGAAGMRNALGDMTPDQRAKLVDAMARMSGLSVSEVAEKIGLTEADFREEEAAAPTEPAAAPAPPEPEPAPTVSPDEGAPLDHEVEDAEDREDLAREMSSNPHSEQSKGILQRLFGRMMKR